LANPRFAPSREALLLRPIVRTRFQFVVLTRVAIEVENFLRVFDFRHNASPSESSDATEPAWNCDAEASASSDASASCYGFSENIGVLAVVVAELELVQVKRQIFLGNVVIGPDYSALQQAPEVLHVVRVNDAPHVLAVAMADRLMRQTLPALQILVAAVLVSRDQINLVADRFGESGEPEELAEKFGLTAPHIAAAALRVVERKRKG